MFHFLVHSPMNLRRDHDVANYSPVWRSQDGSICEEVKIELKLQFLFDHNFSRQPKLFFSIGEGYF